MELENLMLHERSQTQIIPYDMKCQEQGDLEAESRWVVAWSWGGMGNAYGVSFQGDENVLELVLVVAKL